MIRLRPQFSLRHWIAVVGPWSHTWLRHIHGSPSETLEHTSSSSSSNSDLTVLYLTNSCGLSPVAALSVAKKLRLRTTDNADSVLNHLRAHGFTEIHITKIITKAPVLLSLNSEKIIKPKLDFLFTAGFSTAAIAKEVITDNPSLLCFSLARKLEPNFNLLKSILGGANEAAKAISAYSRILHLKVLGNMLPNMKTLEEHGVPRDRIIRAATAYTRFLLQSPAQFSKEAASMKKKGFDPLKNMFVGGIEEEKNMRGMSATRKNTSHIREFLLVTLCHIEIEEREKVTPHIIIERIQKCFQSRAIIVAKEPHKKGGFDFHVGIWNKDASRHTATKILAKAFPEFEGAQLNLKFHKAWGTICQYLTKSDFQPTVWGEYDLKQILDIARAVQKHKEIPTVSGEHDLKQISDIARAVPKLKKVANISHKELLKRLKACDDWFQIYKDPYLVAAAIKSYSSLRNVFDDLAVKKEMKVTPKERIQKYMTLKGTRRL